MLLLGSRTITIEGITIFPDHADPNQFWYLPGPVQLSRRDGRAAFTFIKYKPAAVAGGAKGGGFLTFEVDLRLDPVLERRILSKLRAVAKDRPILTAVPFDDGTVQCIALNLQGAGGTAAQPAGPGSFRAVEQIWGASVPSLQGDNTAAFSLTLSQEGATVLEKAFEQGTEPVGVIYNLQFTGMRPALHVEITADLERAYSQLSGGVEAQVYFVKAGIDAAFEKLVQDGTIQIKVLNFTGEADENEKEKWALDFFKENLLKQWFEPTLTPGQIAGGIAQPEPLDQVLKRGDALRPAATPAPPKPGAAPAEPSRPAAGPSPTKETGKGEKPDAGYNAQAPAAPPPKETSPTEGTGSPAVSDKPAAPAAVGVGVPPARATSLPEGLVSAPGGAGAGATGTPALVSFKLRYVRQEERKKIKVVYDRSEATQRTYAPQSFFGLLVADLERGKHFVEVDLDDPFFRVFAVQVEAPIDFGRIGLNSAHLSLKYGDTADTAALKQQDFVFDRTRGEPRSFEVFMNARLDTDYEYAVQYHFQPLSDWEGSTFSYELPPRRIEDRTLLLNPFETIGFLEIQVKPAKIDWGVVDSIDVHLAYPLAGGEQLEKTIVLAQQSEPQVWKIRLDDRKARTYTYRFVHRLKDGTTRETEPVASQAALVPVDDPFPGSIDIEFLPLYDSEKIKTVFIDVEYDDPDNQYRREERLKLAGETTDSALLSIAVLNPALKTFRYRLTWIGADNSMRRGPFAETAETLIAVMEQNNA